MRVEEIWDKWVTYDDDGFYSGIREDAPNEVKEAYAKYVSDREAAMKAGKLTK